MSNESQPTRGFIHFGRAWYAKHNNHRDGMIDLVTFGDWLPDGSGHELNVVWYTLGPRLEVFSDSWFDLAGMSDLISSMGNLPSRDITPTEFCELLTALGFEDRTPVERPGAAITTPNN